MLRITTIDAVGERTLVVEGKLIEPWVAELERVWHSERQALHNHKVVLDLREVTIMNAHAEDLLLQIMREGAQFVCYGTMNKHLLQKIERRCKNE